jgi:hypothetical protein
MIERNNIARILVALGAVVRKLRAWLIGGKWPSIDDTKRDFCGSKKLADARQAPLRRGDTAITL